MARIPTPIPESTAERLSSIARGPILDLLWKVLVTVVVVGIALTLAAAGGAIGLVGGVLAIIVLSIVLERPLTEAFRDIWNRNFWVWRT